MLSISYQMLQNLSTFVDKYCKYVQPEICVRYGFN